MSEGRGKVLAVRAMPGANCSSVGSVVDLLFVAGVVGAALLVTVTATLDDEARRRDADVPPPNGDDGTDADAKATDGPGANAKATDGA